MRIFIAFFWVFCAFSVIAAEDPSLLFKVDFDNYHVTANHAKGKAESRNFHADLQLRMHPGIDGKGNALRLNGHEFCAYPMAGNFDPQCGTVNLWVSAENWSFTDKRYHCFFEAKQPDFRLIIYKNSGNPFVCVYLQYPGGVEMINAWVDVPDWQNKKWHMVTAVWDADAISIYIDGKLPKIYNPGNAHAAFPHKKFQQPKKLPKADRNGSIGLGNLFRGFRAFEEDHTALDELAIYNRCLQPQEILALYEAKRPPAAKKLPPPELTIPQSSPIKLDGIVDEAEYADAAHMPLLVAYKTPNHTMQNNTKIRLKTDGKNLLIGFDTDLPVTARKMTANDQDIFLDDAFEFFIRTPKHELLWFCINANGAIFDAKNNDRKWNSNAQGAAKLREKGWSAEIVIPLTALNDPAPGSKYRANFRVLNFSSSPHYYMSWNGNPQANEGLSSIVFSGTSSCVSLKSLGEIYKGKVNTDIVSDKKLTMRINGQEISGNNGRFVKDLPAGKYLLELFAENGFNYNLEFFVNFPLSTAIKSYPASGFAEVKVDLGNAGSKVLSDLANYRGKIQLIKNGKVCASVDFKPQQLSYVKLPVNTGLDSGKYDLKITVSGKTTLVHSIPFRVPDMTPYQKKVAADHTVPSPWVKVTVKDANSFDILDRTYIFNHAPFPEKMISRGADVLLSQPVLTIDGKAVNWSGRKITERFDDYIVMTGQGSCGNLKFDWRGELWFDGLWKLDFSMKPDTARNISSMQLKWSVPENSAKCFMQRLHSGYIVTPWDKSGRIEKKLNLDDASWLTGHVTGMVWHPLSGANWVAGNAKTTILQQQHGKVDVTLNIIAGKVTLTKTADYSIAFMATPAKRPVKNFRTICEGSYMNNPCQNIQISSTGNAQREDAVYGYASHIMRFPDKFREKWIKPYAARNIKIFPYHQPKGISKLDDEWDFFLAEWRSNPGYIQANLKYGDDNSTIDLVHCCGEGIADLMAYLIDKLYTDFPELGGIYYDISDVKHCDNTAHGHGGIDAFGQKYYDSTAMTLRHYMMRIYKVSRKYGKRTFIHAHNYFNPVAHNFADIWYPGEEFVWLYGNDPDHFYSEIPPAELQYAYNPIVRGTAIVRCNQVSRVQFMEKLKPRIKELQGEKMAIRSFVSAWLHDFTVDSDWINDRAVARFWQVRVDMNLDEAEFYGYWFNDAVKSASPKVYVSWYKLDHPEYSHLLIVGNLGRKDQKAALSVNWQKLGVANGNVTLKELWENKDFPLSELANATVRENHFLLIGVKK